MPLEQPTESHLFTVPALPREWPSELLLGSQTLSVQLACLAVANCHSWEMHISIRVARQFTRLRITLIGLFKAPLHYVNDPIHCAIQSL